MIKDTKQRLCNLCCLGQTEEFQQECLQEINKLQERLADLEAQFESASVDDRPYLQTRIREMVRDVEDLELMLHL